jgi:hypothetical protein
MVKPYLQRRYDPGSLARAAAIAAPLIGDALAYPPTPALPANLDATATTVVAVAAPDAAESASDTAAILADLAARHELVIVYGHDATAMLSPYDLVDSLRAHLPRFTITTVVLDAGPHLGGAECDLLAELLNEGALAVAVVATPDLGPTVQALAVRLKADTVLRLGYDRVDGVQLRTLTERASPVPG